MLGQIESNNDNNFQDKLLIMPEIFPNFWTFYLELHALLSIEKDKTEFIQA